MNAPRTVSAPEGLAAVNSCPAWTGEDGQPRPGAACEASEDAVRREAAARVRRERPGWVVIWAARKGEYQARPLFRAPCGTVAAGATPGELTAQMDRIEQAARPRPRR